MTAKLTAERVPNPTIVAAVVVAMQAGHTTTPGICLASGYSAPTVNACLHWMRAQGNVRTTKERPPRIPGKVWRGLQFYHALVSVPSPPERERVQVNNSRAEPWDFAALMAVKPLGSRPANMPAGRVHRMGD